MIQLHGLRWWVLCITKGVIKYGKVCGQVVVATYKHGRCVLTCLTKTVIRVRILRVPWARNVNGKLQFTHYKADHITAYYYNDLM